MIGGRIGNGGSIPATISYPLGENIWIIAGRIENALKMVQIEITGQDTFNWIDASITLTETCFSQQGFTESCFTDGVNQSRWGRSYDVSLVTIQEGTGNRFLLITFSTFKFSKLKRAQKTWI